MKAIRKTVKFAAPLLLCALLTIELIVPAHVQALEEDAATASGIALAPLNAESLKEIEKGGVDTEVTGRVPNYLRLLAASQPKAVNLFAHLYKSTLYGGTLEPELKAAMGLRIATVNGSAYLVAHLTRLLNTTEKGKAALAQMAGAASVEKAARQIPSHAMDTQTRLALLYADHLTRGIHGVTDAEFAQARPVFNDAQIVELTMTTCLFNYFARLCQGSGLRLETWVTDAPTALPTHAARNEDEARISLASDAEMQMAARLQKPSPELKKGLGIAIANSQRAMLRVPDIAEAWWSYWQAIREDAIMPRETLLQISFAVSMANGCRYCTLHQVAGLRRLGVEPAKLIAMQKDDSMLDPKERACVLFARKLTRMPSEVAAADFAALRKGVGSDREAMEALLQTCAFNFMNRFTDSLHLPSEDEAVHTYNEVYGPHAYEQFHATIRQ